MRSLKTWSGQIEFWFLWTFVLGVSWPAITIISSSLPNIPTVPVAFEVRFTLSLVLSGVLVGLAQWLVLRPMVSNLLTWTLASACGWAAGMALAIFVIRPAGFNVSWFAGGFLGGLIFGAAQWLVMRPDPRIGWNWALLSAASLSLALGLGAAFQEDGGIARFGEKVSVITTSAFLGWAILGIVALLALLALFPEVDTRDRGKPTRWMP